MKLGHLLMTRGISGALAMLALVGCGTDSGESSTEGAASNASALAEDADDSARALACPPVAPPDGALQWSRDLDPNIGLAPASVATDAAGNAYYARFETGVVKLDPAGNQLWQVALGQVVAADSAGNAYVGAGAEGSPATVTKLGRTGNTLWTRSIGTGAVQSIAVDANRNIVASGPTLGTVKLNAGGHLQWSKSFGGHAAFDPAGAVLLTGSFVDTVDFGGGPVTSRGKADAFIVKLRSNGAFQWNQILGDADLPINRPSGGTVTQPSDQRGEGIASDPQGNVLIAGLAIDSIKFFGDNLATPVAAETGVLPLAYLAKLDRTGAVIWKTTDSAVRDVRGLATDPHGNVILSGGLVGNVAPGADTFIEKRDPAGALLWRHESPGQGFSDVGFGDAVATDRCGDIFWAVESVDLTPARTTHALLQKLRP